MLVASVLLTCRVLSRFQNGEDGTCKEVTYNLEKEGWGKNLPVAFLDGEGERGHFLILSNGGAL